MRKVIAFIFLMGIIFLGSVIYLSYREKTDVEQSEKELIFEAAREYVEAKSADYYKLKTSVLEFDLKLIEYTDDWTLVEVIPKDKAVDRTKVILEKVAGGWKARAMGTTLSEWSKKAPALFD